MDKYVTAPPAPFTARVKGRADGITVADDASGRNSERLRKHGAVGSMKYIKVDSIMHMTNLEVVVQETSPPEFPSSNPTRTYRAGVRNTDYVAVLALEWEPIDPYGSFHAG